MDCEGSLEERLREKPAHACAQRRAGSSSGPVLIPPIGVRVVGVASHLSWQVSFSGNQIHALQGATCSLWPGAGAGREPEPTCPAVPAPRIPQHAAVSAGQHAEVRRELGDLGSPGETKHFFNPLILTDRTWQKGVILCLS